MAVPQLYSAGMDGNAGDSQQISLVKIVAQLYDLVVTSGGMSVPQLYSKMSANTGDSIHTSLVKIVALLNAYTGGGSAASSGTTNLALSGANPPSDGSVGTEFVFDTDTGFLWYNSGTIASPTWNNV